MTEVNKSNQQQIARVTREIEHAAEKIMDLAKKLASKNQVYLDGEANIQKGHHSEAKTIAWQVERLVQSIKKNLETHITVVENLSEMNLSTFKGDPVFFLLLESIIKWYDAAKQLQKLTEKPFNLPRTLFDKSVVQRAKLSRIDAGILQAVQSMLLSNGDAKSEIDAKTNANRMINSRISESFGSFFTVAPGLLGEKTVYKIRDLLKK